MYKFLTTTNCPGCVTVRKAIPNLDSIARTMDALSPEGMAEMSFHGIQAVPALITPDDRPIVGASNIIAHLRGV